MTRLVSFVAVLATAACSFSPAVLPLGTPDANVPDAPIVPDGTPLPPDAMILPDGATDAPPEICPGTSKVLTLSSEQTSTLAGPAVYDPSCTGNAQTGAADFYRLEVSATNSPDLVVEVTPTAPLDAIVDITTMCQGQPGAGICEDSSGAGAPEVAVVPGIQPGRQYIAVDSRGDVGGAYSITAFTRAVVSKGASCSRDLFDTRCPIGAYCIDLDNDGIARCEEVSTQLDVGNNEDACSAAISFANDGVYSGTLSSASDVDVVEINGTGGLVAVISSDGGGCPADLKLELLEGGNCSTTTVAASDDNSGLGPCPILTVPSIGQGKKHWLRVSAAAGARVSPSAPYTMVVDFVP